MKRKILGGVFALAVMAAAGYGVNKSAQDDADLSDMALSNVEALAWFEGMDGDNHNEEKLVSYPCKKPSDGAGCGNIGLTGPSCGQKRYC